MLVFVSPTPGEQRPCSPRSRAGTPLLPAGLTRGCCGQGGCTGRGGTGWEMLQLSRAAGAPTTLSSARTGCPGPAQ